MNPSFLPPAPLSDALRTKIYKEFMRDPEENSVRVLSQKYHIGLKRIDAILRLKGLESAWKKVCLFFLVNSTTVEMMRLRLVFKTFPYGSIFHELTDFCRLVSFELG